MRSLALTAWQTGGGEISLEMTCPSWGWGLCLRAGVGVRDRVAALKVQGFITGTCENRIHELIVVDDGYTRLELYHLSSDISCGFPSSERDMWELSQEHVLRTL